MIFLIQSNDAMVICFRKFSCFCALDFGVIQILSERLGVICSISMVLCCCRFIVCNVLHILFSFLNSGYVFFRDNTDEHP